MRKGEGSLSGQKMDIGQQAISPSFIESKSHLFFLTLYCPLFVQHAVLCGDLLAKQIVFSSEAMIWRQKGTGEATR